MQGFSTYSRIHLTRQGRILTVALSAGSVNAVDAAMHHELARVFTEAQDDADSDLIVLTGEGKAFCAGGDTTWFKLQIDEPKNFRAIVPEAKRIVSSLLDLEKPIICRFNGAAAGLGATIALLCDVVVAAENAVIGDPHVKVGLVAGDGGALIWPQLIGYAKAKRYLFTGDLLTAAEAERIGLISEVVPDADLDASVYGLAEHLAAGPLKAMNWTKVVANLPLKALFHAHFDAGVAYESMSNLSADHQEAVAAFREKRKPVFTGK